MLHYFIHVIGIISASYNSEDNEDPNNGFKASLKANNRRNTGTNKSGRWAGRDSACLVLIQMKIKGTSSDWKSSFQYPERVSKAENCC